MNTIPASDLRRAAEAGRDWYPSALAAITAIAESTGVAVGSAVLAAAALSPLQTWKGNLTALRHVCSGRPGRAGLGANDAAARRAVAGHPDPWLGGDAPKVRSFAAAILGDHDAVVIDRWMVRVFGLPAQPERADYWRLANAFRARCRRLGLSPRDVQAGLWILERGTAH